MDFLVYCFCVFLVLQVEKEPMPSSLALYIANLSPGKRHMLSQVGFSTLDTAGNCQGPVFSLGVSQHMHEITNL